MKAAGGARERVLPCSRLWIGHVPLTGSRETKGKCWGKDSAAGVPRRQQANACRGKSALCLLCKCEPMEFAFFFS